MLAGVRKNRRSFYAPAKHCGEHDTMSQHKTKILVVIVAIIFLDLYTPWFYVWSFLAMSLRIAYEKDHEYRLANPDPLPLAPRQPA